MLVAPVYVSPPIRRIFSRHDLVPQEPNFLWRIEQGVVRTLCWSEEGTAIASGYWGQKDVVGQPLSSNKPYQIQCLTPVEVSLIPDYLWHQELDAIRLHAQQTEEILNIVRSKQVYQRLKQLLFWLAQKFGRRVEQGTLIDLPITHQDIADMIGTTRVTVTRELQKFEQEGIITRPYRKYILLRKGNGLKETL
ncbi:MAG: Crp/Fnr family transcriptional regulator [Microcoleus sp. SIO2G3]|nr:Crp/Fnr family transcriptional regulator [Microcoleus sp. SIO2G3]